MLAAVLLDLRASAQRRSRHLVHSTLPSAPKRAHKVTGTRREPVDQLANLGEPSAQLGVADLVAEHLPHIPWRGPVLEPGSRRALVDTSAARELLGWEPKVTWADRYAAIAAAAGSRRP